MLGVLNLARLQHGQWVFVGPIDTDRSGFLDNYDIL